MNTVIETIKKRRSIRRFKEEQIKDEELQAILEAGVYAPSAMNQQPWHFTVIRDQNLLDHISKKVKEVIAKHENQHLRKLGEIENYHIFYHAPTVVIISGKKESLQPIVDCSAALQNMLIAAESLGIGSCWIGLIPFFTSIEEEKGKIAMPQGYEAFFGVALGYKETSEIPIPKRNLEEVVTYMKNF